MLNVVCFRQIASILAEYYRDSPSLWFHLGSCSSSPTTSKSQDSDSPGARKSRKYPYGHLWSKVNNLKEAWRKKNPEEYKKLKEANAKRTITERKRKGLRPKRTYKKTKPATSPPLPQKTLQGESTD